MIRQLLIGSMMQQILVRYPFIVNFIALCSCLYAHAETQTAETKRSYRVELLAYQQPTDAAFGNVQPSKYKHLVDKPDLPILDNHRGYVDTTHTKSLATIANRLSNDLIANQLFSWVVQLQPQESIALPLTSKVLQGGNDLESTVNGFNIRGSLLVSRNQYIDIASEQTLEILREGQVFQFDHTSHNRHLKLDKMHYLDNEYVGILVKVSLADFTPPEVTPVSTTDSTTDADSSHARASDEGDDQSTGVRSSNSQAVPTPLSTTDEDSPSSDGRDDQMKSIPTDPATSVSQPTTSAAADQSDDAQTSNQSNMDSAVVADTGESHATDDNHDTVPST